MIFKRTGQIILTIAVFLSSTIHADETFHFDKSRLPYQLRQSSQELVDIHQQLKVHNTSYVGLERIIADLNRISKIGDNCQVELKKGLQQIDNISKQIQQVEDKTGFEETYKNFEYDKKVKKATLIYCQLISYYSEKYLFEANQQIFQKPKNRISNASVIELLNTPHLMDYPLKLSDLYAQFGMDYFSSKDYIQMFVVLLFTSMVGLVVGLKISQSQSKSNNHQFLSYLYLDKMHYILPIFLPLFCEMILLFNKTAELLNPPVIRTFIYMSCFNLFILYLVLIITKGLQYEKDQKWGKKIRNHAIYLFLINGASLLSVIFFNFVLQKNPLVLMLFKLVYMLLSTITVYFWYLLLMTCTEFKYYSIRKHKFLARLRIIGVFFSITIQIIRLYAIVIGYNEFAVNFFSKIFILAFFAILLFLISQLFIRAISSLESGEGRFVKYVRYFLSIGGANLQQKEFVYFKLLLIIYFVIFFISIFFKAMDVPSLYLLQFNHYVYDGFNIFNFKLIPIRLLNASIVFVFLIFASKWLAKYISRTVLFKYDSDRRSTLSLIIKYMGYFLAVVISIGILGISLENLSMIIGFFSLGIGIGMQSIVIDLISGLIILGHKPIRINDYVTLTLESYNVTGHIQKILLLSTQIITDDQSVVHVRNTNLLKANLENHTLYNQITKCFIPFALSEVTEFEKAKSIILNVVKKKTEIVQSGANEPMVLLDSTNAKDYESSVVINLLFYMKKIELKQYVIDEIMKKILQEFQKNGIKYILVHDHPHQ